MSSAGRSHSTTEFVAMTAMLLATVAFSIDAMLPALPEIAADLTPDARNRAQLIVTSFVLGMGVGTLISGPLSDAWGRKPVVMLGGAIYCTGALIGALSQSLEIMLAARVVQGLGAAGPRVVTLAMVRDVFAGREMARIMSFVLLVFSLVPALAPTLGYYIIALSDWRGVFVAFICFAILSMLWLGLRQEETLDPAHRRPLQAAVLWDGVQQIFATRSTVLAMLAQSLAFGILFITLSSTQQVFDQTFGEGDRFHLWFGGIAAVAASMNLLNARLVGRLGMRTIIRRTFAVQVVVTSVMIAVCFAPLDGPWALTVYALWTLMNFMQAGLTLGNLNALAMEPLGHIAGIAASVTGAVSTVLAVIIAVPVAQLFDGTPLPMAWGVLICAAFAYVVTTRIARPGDVRP